MICDRNSPSIWGYCNSLNFMRLPPAPTPGSFSCRSSHQSGSWWGPSSWQRMSLRRNKVSVKNSNSQFKNLGGTKHGLTCTVTCSQIHICFLCWLCMPRRTPDLNPPEHVSLPQCRQDLKTTSVLQLKIPARNQLYYRAYFSLSQSNQHFSDQWHEIILFSLTSSLLSFDPEVMPAIGDNTYVCVYLWSLCVGAYYLFECSLKRMAVKHNS